MLCRIFCLSNILWKSAEVIWYDRKVLTMNHIYWTVFLLLESHLAWLYNGNSTEILGVALPQKLCLSCCMLRRGKKGYKLHAIPVLDGKLLSSTWTPNLSPDAAIWPRDQHLPVRLSTRFKYSSAYTHLPTGAHPGRSR